MLRVPRYYELMPHINAFYLPDGDGFTPTDYTRGPWSPEHQHAGPPAALMGRAVQHHPTPDSTPWPVTRFVLDLLRPIPMSRLTTRTTELRASRSVQEVQVTLHANDRLICKASALRLRRGPPLFPATPARAMARLPDESPILAKFKPPRATGADEGYHNAMDVRLAAGVFGEGPTQGWMRARVPLILGESTSGLCRMLTAADAASGISPALDWMKYTFVNAELTAHLFRAPEGEWIGIDGCTEIAADGVGLASSRLFDLRGVFGRSNQCLLLRRR